jgi:hypothetical protein
MPFPKKNTALEPLEEQPEVQEQTTAPNETQAKPFDPTDESFALARVQSSVQEISEPYMFRKDFEGQRPNWRFHEFRESEWRKERSRLESFGWLVVEKGKSYQGIHFEDMLEKEHFEEWPDGIVGRAPRTDSVPHRENVLCIIPIGAWRVYERKRAERWDDYVNRRDKGASADIEGRAARSGGAIKPVKLDEGSSRDRWVS